MKIKLNPQAAYFTMIGVCCFLGVTLVASTLIVNSLLHKQSDKLVAVKLDNRLLDEQQTALQVAAKTVQKYSELNKIAQSVVPQDKDQAKAVRELVKIADESGIKLGAISFPASTLGQKQAKGKTSSSETQVKPVDGIPGVFVLEINVQQDTNNPTTYPNLINFLAKLENNRRTAQVTNVTVQPTPKDRTKLTFNLVLNTYIKP